MNATLRIWYLDGQSRPQRQDTDQTLWVSRRSATPHAEHQPESVVIHPLASSFDRGGIVGVALVPPELDRRVALNGALLPSGLSILRHADRLDIRPQTIWIASHGTAEPATYDPELHGDNQFCFLSKARLHAGQPIVVCPGVPGRRCSVLYQQQAWELAMQSPSRMHCANCGFRPDLAEWRPPEIPERRTIDEILTALIPN